MQNRNVYGMLICRWWVCTCNRKHRHFQCHLCVVESSCCVALGLIYKRTKPVHCSEHFLNHFFKPLFKHFLNTCFEHCLVEPNHCSYIFCYSIDCYTTCNGTSTTRPPKRTACECVCLDDIHHVIGVSPSSPSSRHHRPVSETTQNPRIFLIHTVT